MFKPVSSKLSFPQMEEDILRFWAEDGTFQKSIDEPQGRQGIRLLRRPALRHRPAALRPPAGGHDQGHRARATRPCAATTSSAASAGTATGCRSRRWRRRSSACRGAADIVAKGVDVFNETCRSMVLTYVEEWRKTVTRMGRWVDFDNDYKTMDLTFMETIWWVFKQLWDQGRVYQSHRIMPYCWKLNTPLSNFEAGSNYQDVQDPVHHRAREAVAPPPRARCRRRAGLCPDLDDHALDALRQPGDLRRAGHRLRRRARRRRRRRLPPGRGPAGGLLQEARAVRDARPLEGRRPARVAYEPIFPYFAGTPNALPRPDRRLRQHRRRHGHRPPGPGLRRRRLPRLQGRRHSPASTPSTTICAFTERVPEYAAVLQGRRQADHPRASRTSGKLVHQSTLVHSYPFCERTDTPLIYRAIEAWYVRVEDLRDRLVANNDTVHWVPRRRRREALRQLAQGGQGLEHQPQPLLGLLHPGLDVRGRPGHDLRRVHRRTGGAVRPEGRPICTSTIVDEITFAAERQDLPPHARGAGLLVRVRLDALRPAALSLRARRRARDNSSRPTSSPRASTRRAAGSTR